MVVRGTMRLGGGEASFRWISPDGREHSGGKWDLVALLSDGTLPPRTLVWKTGWSEWLPASRVGELSDALPPGAIEPAVEPKSSAHAAPPPHPAPRASLVDSEWGSVPPRGAPEAPTAQPAPAPAIAKLPRAQTGSPKTVAAARPPEKPLREVPAPSSFGTLGAAAARPQAVVARSTHFRSEPGTHGYDGARPPLPTLSDEMPATATLRPPAAVPPPPRSSPTSAALDPRVIQRFAREESATDTPLPASGVASVDDTAPTVKRAKVLAPPPKPQRPPLVDPAATKAMASQQASPAEPDPVLGESRPPLPTIPERPAEGRLGVPRLMAPTIPEHHFDGGAASQPVPSELASALVRPSGRSETFTEEPASSLRPLEATLSSAKSAAPTRALPSPEPGLPATRPLEALPASFGDRGDSLARLKLTAYVLGGLAAVLGVLALGLLITRDKDPATATASPAASSSAAVRPAAVACRVIAHPARLGAAIDRSVTPLLAAQGSDVATVGFAESSKKAVGLSLSMSTLDAQAVFQKAVERPLKAVVPLTSAGTPAFSHDVESETMKSPRTVDAAVPFVLGLSGDSIVRVLGGASTPIWPLGSGHGITEIRLATTPLGHLVTFRVGGLEGREMVGWLNTDGTKQSELAALETPKLVGTPFAAATTERWVVAFAARGGTEEPWHVELIHGATGSTEAARAAFQAPPGGLGGGQIAPSIAALPRGHWLLQWTEGKAGMYQVRTQVLGPKLEPLGEASLTSPKGTSSGQGAVYSVGENAASLYVQTIGGHDELWATTLGCR